MKEPRVELTLVDQYDPEVIAMLQAFYSRSHKPIKERLDSLGSDNSSIKESLKQWFVNYGHKSIGQCGDTTLFIEGVSILAAKVFQDTRLYNGQETSTRFINFKDQPIHNPLNIEGLQQRWIDFYTESQQPVMHHVAAMQGLNLEDKKDAAAAKARTFDILRAFVPAGAATQLLMLLTSI